MNFIKKYFHKTRVELIDIKVSQILESIYQDNDSFTHLEQSTILNKLFTNFKIRKGDDLGVVIKEKDDINEALKILEK